MRQHLKDPVVTIFFVIAALVVAGALTLGHYQARVARWPRLNVTVVSSEVVAEAGGRYLGRVVFREQSGTEGSVVTSWGSSDPATMESSLRPFEAGARIALPQNPADPGDLRLPPDPMDAWLPWFLAAGGLLFALVPVGVVALSNRKDALRVGGLVFAMTGALVVSIGVYLGAKKVRILTAWSISEGTVIESQVGFRPGRRGPRYAVDTLMQYQVAGQEMNAMVGSASGQADRSEVEQELKTRFAPGSQHEIRYNPEFPKEATYEAEWTPAYFWEALLFFGLGLVMTGLGWAMARFLRD